MPDKHMNEHLYPDAETDPAHAPEPMQGAGEPAVPEDLLTPSDYAKINDEVAKDRVKGLIQQIGGVLSALLLFLGTLNIEFSWLTEESINAFLLTLAAAAALGVSLFSIYKNSHAFRKGQQDNQRIKEAEIAELRLKEKKARQKQEEG